MEVRPLAGRDDVPGVVRAHGLAWREAYRDVLPDRVLDGITVEPDDDAVEEWYARVREDRDRFLVAVHEGSVRGYIYLRWGGETKDFVGAEAAGLKEIYVEPDYWGQGIGTALLERGLDLLPDGVEALRLEMLAGNAVGERFYESRGFERTGSDEVEIGGDAYPTVIYSLAL